MKIKAKLFIGIGLLFAMIVLLTVIGSININKLSSDTRNILTANYNTLDYSRQMLIALNEEGFTGASIAKFETNLKKQGLLALTFVNPSDYDKVKQGDRVSIIGISKMAPGQNLEMILTHTDGKEEKIPLKHSFNVEQIQWFKAGSALNMIKKN